MRLSDGGYLINRLPFSLFFARTTLGDFSEHTPRQEASSPRASVYQFHDKLLKRLGAMAKDTASFLSRYVVECNQGGEKRKSTASEVGWKVR